MTIIDLLVNLMFGTLYGGLIFGIALLAAIPYGIWQGMRRVWARRPGGSNGNT